MLNAVTKHRLRRLDSINCFIYSPRVFRCTLPFRGLHAVPQAQPRRTYTAVALAVTTLFSLAGLTFYAVNTSAKTSNVGSAKPADDTIPDKTEALKLGEGDEPTKAVGPPTGFDDIPPLKYDRSLWRPDYTRNLEEELEAESRIFRVDSPCGVPRYDTSVVGQSVVCTSNESVYVLTGIFSTGPISCFSSASFIELPTHYWVFFGIYDGHNGNKVSSYLSQNLRHSIMGTLADLYSKHATLPDAHIYLGSGPETADYWSGSVGRPYPPSEEFDAVLKQAFLNIDKDITKESAERALNAIQHYTSREPQQDILLSYQGAADLVSRAHCGSSAIVAVYESDTRQLRMVNLGDSRAVLGRRTVDDEGKEVYEVHVLTHELAVPSGFVTDPVRRPQVAQKLLHAFGHGPWKWDTETRQRLTNAFPFILSHERPFAKVTAEPVITSFETQPGDFLVIANQGLWASLTNEEAVGLVALWLKKFGRFVFGNPPAESGEDDDVYDAGTSSVLKTFTRFPTSTYALLHKDVFAKQDLPVSHSAMDDTFMYRMWGVPKRFVLADKNAAQHLVRNALGGADRDLMEALLKMQPPRARRRWYACDSSAASTAEI